MDDRSSLWRLCITGKAAALLAVMILAVSALVSGSALAQQAPSAPSTSGPPSPPLPPQPSGSGTPATVVDDDQIDSLLGQKVQSPKGEDLGRIVDLLVDRSGEIRAAVIDFGGFFGVGSRKIAVDWRALHFDAAGQTHTIVADLPPDRLRVSPIYKEGEPVVILGLGQGVSKSVPTPAQDAVPSAPK